MKREGGAAVLERPRAGECLRGVLGLGLAPWGRAVGPGGEGVLGAREGGGGRVWGAGLRPAGISLSVHQLVRRSLPSSILSLFIPSSCLY